MEKRNIYFSRDGKLSIWSDDINLFKKISQTLSSRFKKFVIFKNKIYCFGESFSETYIFSSSDLENIESVHRSLGMHPPFGERSCVTFDGVSRILVFGSTKDNNLEEFRKIYAFSITSKKWSVLNIKLQKGIEIRLASVLGDGNLYLAADDRIFSVSLRHLHENEEKDEDEGEDENEMSVWKTVNSDASEEILKKIDTIVMICEDLVFLLKASSEKNKREEKEEEEVEGEQETQESDECEVYLFDNKNEWKVEEYHGLRSKEEILDYSYQTEFGFKKDWIGDMVDHEFIAFIEYSLTVKRKKEQLRRIDGKIQNLQSQKKKQQPKIEISKLIRQRNTLDEEIRGTEVPKIIFLKFLENLVRTFPIYVSEYEKALKKLEAGGNGSGNGTISWMLSFFKTSQKDDEKNNKIKRAQDVIYYYPVHVDHVERSFGNLGKEYKVNEYLKAVFNFFLFSSKSSYYLIPNINSKKKNEEEETTNDTSHEYGLVFKILTLEDSVEEIIEKVVQSNQYVDLPPKYRRLFALHSRELFASDLTTNFHYDQIILDKSYLRYFKVYKRSLSLLKPFFTHFNPSGYIEYLLKFFLFSKLGILFFESALHIKQTESDLEEIERKIRSNENSLFDDFKKVFIQKQSIFEWRRIQQFTRIKRGNSKFEINYDRFIHLLGLNIPRVRSGGKGGPDQRREVNELIEYFQKVSHLREKKMLMKEIRKENVQREIYDIINTFTPFLNYIYEMCDVSHLIDSWIATVGKLIEIIENENKFRKALEVDEMMDKKNRIQTIETELYGMFDSFSEEVYKAFKNFFQNDLKKDNIIRNSTRWCKAVREMVHRNAFNDNCNFHRIYFLEKDEKLARHILLQSIENGFGMMNEENDNLFHYDKIPAKE